MSGKLQRYDFTYLRDFRGPIPAQIASEDIQVDEALLAPLAPTFSEADIESARLTGRKTGFSEGFEAGTAQAKKDADLLTHEANSYITKMGDAIAGAQKNYQDILTREGADLADLILMIAKKVAGDALDQRSAETITQLVNRCLPVLFSKPRVIVDLNPSAFERVIERIETTLQAQGYEGEIQFRANPNLGVHDVTLDWGSGVASRNTAALWEEISALIERIPLEMTFAETLNTNDKTAQTTLETPGE